MKLTVLGKSSLINSLLHWPEIAKTVSEYLRLEDVAATKCSAG